MPSLNPRTPLNAILKGVTADTPADCTKYVRDAAKNDDPQNVDLWAKILMACTMDQVSLLQHIWHRYPPDDTVTATWFTIVQRGFFIDFIDSDNEAAKERFLLCHACVDAGRTLADLKQSQPRRSRPGLRHRAPAGA